MSQVSDDEVGRNRESFHPMESGPYVLKPLLENVPVRTENGFENTHITCVEYWNSNLYIGTSASEVLHFVFLPPEPDDDAEWPTFILASRLEPAGHGSPLASSRAHGVRQILLLPGPAKACILCNGVVSFYSLPELTPAFPNREPSGVQWIGGIDENEDMDNPEGQVVMIANTKRILLVRVGERLRAVKNNIEFPACLRASRRDTIACVADIHTYSLVEVEHQQKIPLFPISSTEDSQESVTGQLEDLKAQEGSRPGRSSSLAHRDSSPGKDLGHSRSASLGTSVGGASNRQKSLQVPGIRSGSRSPAPNSSPERHGARNTDSKTPASTMPSTEADLATDPGKLRSSTSVRPLKPHIISPSTTEFLLTTGTDETEPGVGLFVNLDGDVVRGTLEFRRYPSAVIIDQPPRSPNAGSIPSDEDQDACILALMGQSRYSHLEQGIEVQSLSTDPVIAARSKAWIKIPMQDTKLWDAGMHKSVSPSDHSFPELGNLLRMVRLRISGPRLSQVRGLTNEPSSQTKPSHEHSKRYKEMTGSNNDDTRTEKLPEWEITRNKEELAFVKGMGWSQSRAFVWSHDRIWRIVRNPTTLQLETALLTLETAPGITPSGEAPDDNAAIIALLGDIRDREAKTESDFLGLNYIRQKASLMLFHNLVAAEQTGGVSEADYRSTQSSLMEGGIDPRVIMMLLPMLHVEALQGSEGVWVHQGLADLVRKENLEAWRANGRLSIDFWMMIKRYLTAWQGKRGFGSIPDEQLVFDSVDAALLHVLLHLEHSLPPSSPALSSLHAKLNNVVDHWKGHFDRAVLLLEEYHRLFILSRLYQSQKLAKDVLATWKRIIEGEADVGGELSPSAAEVRVCHYLGLIRDAKLVEEYGLWLATRNPDLAIKLFTDDSSRVKFKPQQMTAMLKEHAPGAVQHYLEHLVFKKHLSQYSDDLIGYYLDSVLNVLEKSEDARASLAQSYATYRALEKPKPTYLKFITDNALDESWWQSRLRLLQLLGGWNYAPSSPASAKELTYSIPTVLKRLAPFSSFLVSESIILDARQGQHKEALRLLTHGLGDYDTAIRYCYFGGPAPIPSGTIDASFLPSKEVQQGLFKDLFREFLAIEDTLESVQRTSELLGKFATWFDPLQVFESIPDSWSVELLSEFLLRTLRIAMTERDEAAVVKALSAAQNLQKQAEFIFTCEKLGPKLENVGGLSPAGDTDASQSIEISQNGP